MTKPKRKYGTIVPEKMRPATWHQPERRNWKEEHKKCSTTGCEEMARYTLFGKRIDVMGRQRQLNFCELCVGRLPERLGGVM